eukprot:10072384-Heterocapsa_arctica.AAC.1
MESQEEKSQRGRSQGDGLGAKAAKTTAKPKSAGRRTRETEGAAEVQAAKKAKVPVTSTGGFQRLFGQERQEPATGTASPVQGSSSSSR